MQTATQKIESFAEAFAPFARRMQAEGLPSLVIDTFQHYYRQLLAGASGLIPESEIEPVDDLPQVAQLPAHLARTGARTLPHTVMIKLNGGLGTTMGMQGPKSLLKVRGDLTFLDIIARQALHSGVHLVLMNSFHTRAASLAALQPYKDLRKDIPLDFVQHKVPKIDQATLQPVTWPQNPQLEWNPPGHGDLYTALITSGMLQKLLAAGIEYAFVSNVDNLGAVIDPVILGYMVQEGLPFLMEVAERTAMDRKGGHLARRGDQLILREAAQCPPGEVAAFQDIQRYRYFNTNNIWLHLPALQKRLQESNGMLNLPLIVNRKSVDPRDPTSTPVFQLETAMGSAIAVLPGSAAICVSRRRFAPVKGTNELLAVRSDAYELTPDARLIPNPERKLPPLTIDLDPHYYKMIDDLEARFPAGPPSLRDCQHLRVRGDVRFGRDIVLRGEVRFEHNGPEPLRLADGTRLGPEQA